MAAEADLVVLAAPVLANVALVSRLADYIPGDAIVTDVGSTKRDIVTAAAALPPRLPVRGRTSARRRGGGRARGLHAPICSRAGPGS